MNLFTIPAGADFLQTLAQGWLEEMGDDPVRNGEGVILLPSRRAARALKEAFLRRSGGRTLLLPRIVAIGALDEEPLGEEPADEKPAGLRGGLEVPPAVSSFTRLAELTRMILAMEGVEGMPESVERAWSLAVELVRLLEEAHREEVDLHAGLERLAAEGRTAEFAEHWQKTRDFLLLITRDWPRWLAEHEQLDPAARLRILLDDQARRWSESPPRHPVWAVSGSGGTPAVARLFRVVAGLPAGRVILPAFDPSLASLLPLPPTHPQAGMYRLLGRLGAEAAAVVPWPGRLTRRVDPAREEFLREALLPAAALTRWAEAPPGEEAMAGLFRLETANEQEEAEAIALILREVLEQPDLRGALITPDRGLAERVRTELLRYGVVIDDSAGELLLNTPPAVFLRLVAEVVAEDFAVVPLLALLKHPLTALGLGAAETRRRIRLLEHLLRRDHLPRQTRLPELRRFVAKRHSLAAGVSEAIVDLLDRLEEALAPLESLRRSAIHPGEAAAGWMGRHSPRVLLGALIEAGERVAADETSEGEERLWAYEEGVALAGLLREALPALDTLPDQDFPALRSLFEAVVGDAVVRTRRSLRGREGAEHPRLVIWGTLEARLQSADLVVLGGMVEGVWPAEADPGPWLSRPMRVALGLPSSDEALGDAAHDFLLAAAAAPTVIFSAPARRNRAPAVPSRWLARIEALCRGRLPRHPAGLWVRRLDRPAHPPRPAPRPAPHPPLGVRPERLSVSDVVRWRRNPYAIYARHILRLAPLFPLHHEVGPAEFGQFVHAALARWVEADDRTAPEEKRAEAFLNVFERLRLEENLHPSLIAWWRPRFSRIVEGYLAWEKENPPPLALRLEAGGEWPVRPRFRLTARADRIERGADGTITLIDYKTGSPPGGKLRAFKENPQLLLEALMVREGGFGPEFRGEVGRLLYLHLRGRVKDEPYEKAELDGEQLGRALGWTEAWLDELLTGFYSPPGRPYTAYAVADEGDYALLARTEEWRGW